ncbi:uncharacterized protein BCR38DRAFT_481042 [Pseudomassariella vexata]|uniref:Uncharacterized protein n=1 Tax=Pseudomassariella vexata TaxID=1141098 RepID=A0A1Y2EE70_9PEZI|nr:uncharacterized protein BCR38DRAFT_481042 [Pseudomassariella vexata]ORY69881.1 hypothetical protein BCR38DRAFT_481042 [Pseudomassariella vexata]
MGLKSKWRIGGRKPSSSSGENDTTGSLTPTDSEGPDLVKTQSRFMRTLTGGFKSSKAKKRTTEGDAYAHLNRPFTQQNLEHQKLLSSFVWSFGNRKPSHGGRSSASGISPSASRHASVDSNYLSTSHGERREPHTRFRSSLAHESPREVPGEESDREQEMGVLPKAPHVEAVH